MLRNCAGSKCSVDSPQMPLSVLELELIGKYEGQCVTATASGETIKGAVVEVRLDPGVDIEDSPIIKMDFVGGYGVECPLDQFIVEFISREEVEGYFSTGVSANRNSLITNNLRARLDQLLS